MKIKLSENCTQTLLDKKQKEIDKKQLMDKQQLKLNFN